jgi:hypothetical protein
VYTHARRVSSDTHLIITIALEHCMMFISFHRMYLYNCRTNTLGRLTSQLHSAKHAIAFAFYSVGIHLPSVIALQTPLLRSQPPKLSDIWPRFWRGAKCSSVHISSFLRPRKRKARQLIARWTSSLRSSPLRKSRRDQQCSEFARIRLPVQVSSDSVGLE